METRLSPTNLKRRRRWPSSAVNNEERVEGIFFVVTHVGPWLPRLSTFVLQYLSTRRLSSLTICQKKEK